MSLKGDACHPAGLLQRGLFKYRHAFLWVCWIATREWAGGQRNSPLHSLPNRAHDDCGVVRKVPTLHARGWGLGTSVPAFPFSCNLSLHFSLPATSATCGLREPHVTLRMLYLLPPAPLHFSGPPSINSV